MSNHDPAHTIIVVDDDPDAREILADILSVQGYQLAFAASSQELFAQLPTLYPDLVLLDVMLPGIDGYTICEQLRRDPRTEAVPIIMITALDDRDSRLRGLAAGADEFLTKPVDGLELRTRVQTVTRLNRYRLLLQEREQREAQARTMAEQAHRQTLELTEAYDMTLLGWSSALDLRDKETEGHSQRVTAMAVGLAQRLGIEGEALIHLRRGAMLHDIGKLGVPDAILHKPGPLTDEEWVVMRRHPELALAMLRPIQFLAPALDIPYCHHEKWDGSGYPRGLGGDAIPLSARIFALVDVWDALTNDRPYRTAWDYARAAAHLRAERGRHFDPDLVEPFLSLVLQLGDSQEAEGNGTARGYVHASLPAAGPDRARSLREQASASTREQA
ncbi:MAG: response regulator [Chloroflexales bacterium]|nr:response regulator [Chloroflexales bacterium]